LGKAGVTKANSDRPDLILMDIQMPVFNGYEATRRIKVEPDLNPISIIGVSLMKRDEEKARAAGCDTRLGHRRRSAGCQSR
jgi:two-component system cell cycle response regulator DivK